MGGRERMKIKMGNLYTVEDIQDLLAESLM
jgi:hypothetical protein